MAILYTDQQLRAFLDESLPAELMSEIERLLRSDGKLRQRLADLCGQREAGVHGLGEIWRRHRLSCPTRQQLGSYLLSAMSDDWLKYIRFHIEQVGCRVCQANLDDLRAQSAEQQAQVDERRRKYFQSSAGYLSQRRREQ